MSLQCGPRLTRKPTVISLIVFFLLVLAVYKLRGSSNKRTAPTKEETISEDELIGQVLQEEIGRSPHLALRHLQEGETEKSDVIEYNEVEDGADEDVPLVRDIYTEGWSISPQRKKCHSKVSFYTFTTRNGRNSTESQGTLPARLERLFTYFYPPLGIYF